MFHKEVFTLLLVFLLVLAQGLPSASEFQQLASENVVNDGSRQSVVNSEGPCEPPFHLIGAYCLVIDNLLLGNWSQMRQVCQALGGDLVNMKDANILYDINNYIRDNGLDDVSFWVGASDQEQEGVWVWASDNSAVKMGTPLWGNFYGDEPNGGGNENCAIISKNEFYYMHDDDCGFQSNGMICQPGASDNSRSVDDSQSRKQPKECPPPFEAIGGECLFVDDVADITYYEAVSYCKLLDSHLVRINDANLLGAIYDYLTERGIAYTFWIDGTDESLEDSWVFSDGTSVKRGTPFWDVYRQDSQEPNSGTIYNCRYVNPGRSYFIRDNSCFDTLGAICQNDL